MKITFLGSGGSVPTPDRNLPSLVVNREGKLLMFDCGEGTQKQMIVGKIGLNRDMRIFVTHLHGDHVLGLPGLLMSMSLQGRTKKVEVYGPPGILEFVESVRKTVRSTIAYPVEIYEVNDGKVMEKEDFTVHSAWVDHSVPCLAYCIREKDKPGKFNARRAEELGIVEGPSRKKLQMGEAVKVGDRLVRPEEICGKSRPGLKVVYCMDTRPCDSGIKLAQRADLLIHDSTFDNSMSEKAALYKHSTSQEAAEVAKRAGVKKLVLTHISAMYDNPEGLLRQARRVFKNTVLARDLMTIEVK